MVFTGLTSVQQEGFRQALEDLKCPLCHNILDDPQCTTCNHLFCKACLDEKMMDSSSCPECNIPQYPNDVKRSVLAASIVSSFKKLIQYKEALENRVMTDNGSGCVEETQASTSFSKNESVVPATQEDNMNENSTQFTTIVGSSQPDSIVGSSQASERTIQPHPNSSCDSEFAIGSSQHSSDCDSSGIVNSSQSSPILMGNNNNNNDSNATDKSGEKYVNSSQNSPLESKNNIPSSQSTETSKIELPNSQSILECARNAQARVNEYNLQTQTQQAMESSSSEGKNDNEKREIIILCTGSHPDEVQEMTNIVESLGGKMISHFQDEPVTHVIVKPANSKNDEITKKTAKYYYGLGCGAWILTPDWLFACKRANGWVKEDKEYQIHTKGSPEENCRKAKMMGVPSIFDQLNYILIISKEAEQKRNLFHSIFRNTKTKSKIIDLGELLQGDDDPGQQVGKLSDFVHDMSKLEFPDNKPVCVIVLAPHTLIDNKGHRFRDCKTCTRLMLLKNHYEKVVVVQGNWLIESLGQWQLCDPTKMTMSFHKRFKNIKFI